MGREYKRRALELRDLMAELDPAGLGVSTVQLRLASGHSRDRVMSSLLWLLLHGAVRRTTDAAKLWVRIPDDGPAQPPVDTSERDREVLDSLMLDSDILAELSQ